MLKKQQQRKTEAKKKGVGKDKAEAKEQAAVICTDLQCVIKNAGQARGALHTLGRRLTLHLSSSSSSSSRRRGGPGGRSSAQAENVNIICIFKCVWNWAAVSCSQFVVRAVRTVRC